MFERPNLDPKFNAKHREENQLSSLPFLEKSRYNLMLKRLLFTVGLYIYDLRSIFVAEIQIWTDQEISYCLNY